jgi:hypothetical protein
MGFIPDCRKDENYNYNNLKEADKAYINGYDKAAEQLEASYDFAADSDSLLEKISCMELPDSLKGEDCNVVRDFWLLLMKNYFEATRDEIITSMIDGYEDEDGNI